ncbi:MAG TPA: DNA polymerase IV [Spirochaetia bacterium]|nr:DNA polymerase IV [Spirochaetia bacterium]
MHDILLCDLDAFFASVEQRDHPELRGLPVIVGGQAGERGVVSTCSYEARVFGVHSAMPMVSAVRLCPSAVFLPVGMARYQEVSRQVQAIYDRFATELEPASIDEVYLAVPAGKGEKIARSIHQAVRHELSLPVTVGVAANKLLAKIACELAKPNGVKEIKPADVPGVLWPLPVKDLPGVGPQTGEKLNRMAVYTIGQLAKYPEQLLVAKFEKVGAMLHRYANGIDHRVLQAGHRAVSISEETTFLTDLYDRDEVLTFMLDLAEQVGYHLRRAKLKARTIAVKIRFGDFHTITRSRTLSHPVDGDGGIYAVVRDLFLAHCGNPPWRLVGVHAANFADCEQLAFFSNDRDRDSQMSRTIDALRERYGRKVLRRAKAFLKP